jgi:hypothetical protein
MCIGHRAHPSESVEKAPWSATGDNLRHAVGEVVLRTHIANATAHVIPRRGRRIGLKGAFGKPKCWTDAPFADNGPAGGGGIQGAIFKALSRE